MTRVLLALLAVGCGQINKATEIGNPEMTTYLRGGSATPGWLGPDNAADLTITDAWISVDTITLTDCDGAVVDLAAGGFDLFAPGAQDWEIPARWCGGQFVLTPSSPPASFGVEGDASAVFRGLDGRGQRFEVIDRRASASSVGVDEVDVGALEAAGNAMLFEVDLSVWLAGIDLLQVPDADGVIRLVGDDETPPTTGSFEGSLGVWSDASANGIVDADDGLIASPLSPFQDRDGDGLGDDEEAALGADPDNADTDADGLNDGYEERVIGTSPANRDTDGDGVEDGDEVLAGTDPLEAECCDGDGDGFNDSVDCNDADATVFPGANDPVGDGIDQDCDGSDG